MGALFGALFGLSPLVSGLHAWPSAIIDGVIASAYVGFFFHRRYAPRRELSAQLAATIVDYPSHRVWLILRDDRIVGAQIYRGRFIAASRRVSPADVAAVVPAEPRVRRDRPDH